MMRGEVFNLLNHPNFAEPGGYQRRLRSVWQDHQHAGQSQGISTGGKVHFLSWRQLGEWIQAERGRSLVDSEFV